VEISMEQPNISVNGTSIPEAAILQEIQYHPAEDHRHAFIKAAESLIMGELFKQRAQELDIAILGEWDTNLAEQDRIIELLIEKEVDFPQASPEECERYYQTHLDRFMTSPLFEVRHILIASDPKDLEHRDESLVIAKGILEDIKAHPQKFDTYIKSHSSCPSKETQGNLGQLTKGQTVPEFETALLSNELGLIPYPVETRYGYHIVMIDRRVDGNQLEYDLVKDKVSNYLNDKVKRKALSQYIQVLIGDADIQGFDFDVEQSPLIQ
jgi:peptidyl-prolyl cis-trans isomerase C